MADRPYIFLELTNSLCSRCLRKVEAKIVVQEERVYLNKFCHEHGREMVLISTDFAYYRQCRSTLKPGQLPLRFNTQIQHGCPFDCGLCPDHEQHSCLTLVEITDGCNLTCPVCYSESSPERMVHRSLETVEFMLDAVVANEGQPDVVQISGGEPTIHPEILTILEAARRRPIKHLMLNTNGIRIARDAAFAEHLQRFAPGFEIYLQFDSLRDDRLAVLRGERLADIRRRALDRLNELQISTTLVVTLKKGLNDGEIGEILEFALQQPCVRGVTFQPIQNAGRLDGIDPARDRLTLSEIRQSILTQSDIFSPKDLVPVPCHPDCITMGYAIKLAGRTIPLGQFIDPGVLLGLEGSSIIYERDPRIRALLFDLFSTSHSPQSSSHSLRQLLCCLPKVEVPDTLKYDNVFRVLIVEFLDAWNFDVRSVKRSCIHMVHPDGRIIPFDTYNLFYRDRVRPAGLDVTARDPVPAAYSTETK